MQPSRATLPFVDGVPLDQQVDIMWEAPTECPDREAVTRYAERLLGHPLDKVRGRSVSARGTVQRSELGNWQLHLMVVVGDNIEEEWLTATNCRALSDATALKVALACDPLAVVEAVEPTVPVAPPPPLPPKALPTRRAETKPGMPDLTKRRNWGLRAMGGAGFGQLPGISPGVAIYGSLQFRAFRLELGGQYYLGGEARYEDLPSVGADLELASATARACLTPGIGRWSFPVCAGFEIGMMRGQGFGAATTSTDTSVWGAVIVGPALRFSVTRSFALWVEADALVPVLRPGFHMRNLDSLYVVPAGASRALGGLEVNWGL